MARIKRVQLSEQYINAVKDAHSLDERNDCAVKSLAIAANIPYALARETLKAAGRDYRDGTYGFITLNALDLLGIKHTVYSNWSRSENFYRQIISSYPHPHNELQHITTRHPVRFKKHWETLPPMLLRATGHICAFREGLLHDYAVNHALRVNALIVLEGV